MVGERHSNRRETFVEVYSQGDVSGAEAARQAGYPHARTQASRMLANDDVRQAIASKRQAILQAAGIDAVKELRNVAALTADTDTPATARIRGSLALVALALDDEQRHGNVDARQVHIYLSEAQQGDLMRLFAPTEEQ